MKKAFPLWKCPLYQQKITRKNTPENTEKTSKKNEVDIESLAIIHLATLRIPPEIPPNPP